VPCQASHVSGLTQSRLPTACPRPAPCGHLPRPGTVRSPTLARGERYYQRATTKALLPTRYYQSATYQLNYQSATTKALLPKRY
jgi:hypothetical protein